MERWLEIIITEAKRRWVQNSLLLLSQVPDVLEKAKIDVFALRGGRTLLSTLKEEASQDLSLFQHPNNRALWAVLARESAVGETPESVFSRETKSQVELRAHGHERFSMWFWSAFVKFLDEGKRRWILDGRYIDSSSGIAPPNAIAEVLPEEVAFPGQGVPADSQLVQGRIEAWSRRTGIRPERFFASHHPATNPDLSSGTDRRLKDGMYLNLSALDANDLQKILVPLDVVMKLLASR